jgi:hypothetical protein
MAAAQVSKKMPCGDMYVVSEVCLGMYITGFVGKTALAKFCCKCPIFGGKDLENMDECRVERERETERRRDVFRETGGY